MRYKSKGNIREYIMEMSNLAGKLKTLMLEIYDDLLMSYNTQKKKWTLNKLTIDKTESAHFASSSQNHKKNNSKATKKVKKSDEITCFFYKKAGHMKKDCPKYAASFVPVDNWWVDSGTTTHISGCLWSRPPSDAVKDSSMWVTTIKFILLLKTGYHLDLVDTFIALSFKRNLISTSSLDKGGYFCNFGNGKICISLDSNVIGIGIFLNGLYMLEVVTSHNEILHTSTKCKLNENSALLWHKHLGHISK
ncbi:hypothetical protein V2J09_000735 [Rumex salicifolius]